MTKPDKSQEEALQEQIRARLNPNWRQALLEHKKILAYATAKKVRWALKGG